MLALRLHPDRRLRLHDEPDPLPSADEALVRVTGVGLCGSDRHWVLDGGIGGAVVETPLVLGHEFAGIVESGTFSGRRVAADPAIPCGRCGPCLKGEVHLCLAVRFAGYGGTDGALRELIAWPERCLHPLSDAVSDDVAPLVEPLAVAIHATQLAGPLEGARVAVLGCGPIGLLLVALSRAAGARAVVAADTLAHRLAAAREFGATATIVATPTGDVAPEAISALGAGEADIAFEAAGEAAAVESAIATVRPGGLVVLVGIPSDDRTAFRASVARRKELTIRLSRRSTPDSFRRAVELVERAAIDPAGLVTLRVPLADAALGFDVLVARSGLKVVVEPNRGAGALEQAGPLEQSEAVA
jgi:L-iditol 2-dehydrogenase